MQPNAGIGPVQSKCTNLLESVHSEWHIPTKGIVVPTIVYALPVRAALSKSALVAFCRSLGIPVGNLHGCTIHKDVPSQPALSANPAHIITCKGPWSTLST
eukprot:3348634-Amphidinium_carterae.1